MCNHLPQCPPADASDPDSERLPPATAVVSHYAAARIVAAHPEQGWYLLCNGVIAFDDGLDLLPLDAAVHSYAA